MARLAMVFFSVLLFHSSDAGTFTWLHSDDTVNFMEGETAKFNWSVRVGAGRTWAAVKITRNIGKTVDEADVDLIRRKPSGVDIYLAERGADMDLDVQVNTNVLNVTFTLGNLSRKTDEMYYRITVYDDDFNSDVRYTKLNVDVPSSCTIQPNATTVNETDIISLSVNTTGNPPVNNYTWTHPNGSSPTGITDRWIFTASRHDTGTYKVSVYNGIGDRGYCTSGVTIQFPSSCKLHSNATTVNETDIIWLYVNTTGNPPVNNYIWTHPNGSSPTGITDRWTFPASRHDTGTYKVSVSNGVFGWSYCTRNISVQYKPYDTKISHSPSKTTFCVGSVINITCTSNANPPVDKYFLYQNETLIQENSHGRFTVLLNKPGINNFTCIPKNMIGMGGQQSLAPIDVKEPPGVGDCKIISNSIINGSVIEGEKVTLKCNNITGSEPLTITWANGGHNLPNQNKATLTFDPVNRKHDGYYQMTVSNGKECKEAKGENLKLSVYYKPERTRIQFSPNESSVNEGEALNMTCKAEANPKPYYLWYFKGQLLQSDVNGTISLTNITAENAGEYTCTAVNDVGNSTVTKTLSVNYMREPTCEAVPVTVKEEANITLNCSVAAYPPPNYTWNLGEILMGNNPTVTLTASKDHDKKSFTCTAANSLGSKICFTTALNVLYKPEQTRILFSPNTSTVNEGEAVNMTCKAEANPKPYYLCYFKGQMLQSDVNDTISLTNITADDAGEYTCTAVNDVGKSSATKTLMVEYIREPTCEAIPVTVKEGGKITLNCSVTAYPPAIYTWKQGELIIGNESTITLKASWNLHEKSFTCTAANSRGSKICSTTPLNVLYQPRYVHILPLDLTVKEFGVINLTCITLSNPPSDYTWSLNGRLIEGANSKLLEKYNVSRYDAGEYKCTVSNGLGIVYNVTFVNVIHSPELKCEGKLVIIEGQERNFSCNASGFPPPTYTVRYKGDIYMDRTVLVNLTRTDNGSVITCNASNSLGSGECETVLIVTYKPEQTRIQFSPNVSTVNEGEAVNMTCKAEANPKPYYLWYFKGQMLQSDVNDTISLTNITAKDAGEYTCTAVNDVGKSATAAKKLMVIYFRKPACEVDPVTVIDGTSITLKCSVNAYPEANYTWHRGGMLIGNNSTFTLIASPKLHEESFTCTAANSLGSKICSTTPLNVLYFNKTICSPVNPVWVPINTTREDIINTAGFGNPDLNITCWSAQDGNNGLVSLESQANSTYKMKVDTTVSKEKNIVICRFSNGVDNCYRNFTILKKVASFRVKYKVKLLDQIFEKDLADNTTDAFLILSSKFISVILEIYKVSEKEYLVNVYVISFEKGSVWVNFELELIAKVTNPLQPLRNAVIENNGSLSGLTLDKESLSEGFYIPTTTPPVTTPFTSRRTPTSSTSLDLTIIIIIVVAVIVVLIVVFIGIYCYCKKQRDNRKNSTLVEVEDEVIIMEGRRNDGFSPSQYAQSGPPHISDPAYDSVDGVKKNAKDKNDNQAQPEKEEEEPAYAAVDRSKKKKKQDELLYADLGDFQKNGDRAGGRGGLVLEPLPKGKDTKMPEKYQETIYADIDWKKKPAVTSNTDGPLADMHGQDTEADKDKTVDSTKQNDQKPATVEKDKHGQCADAHKEAQPGESKPPDKTANPPKTNDEKPVTGKNVKPPTKDESEKAFVQNHPAESLRTMNDRDNTTLTTVSL